MVILSGADLPTGKPVYKSLTTALTQFFEEDKDWISVFVEGSYVSDQLEKVVVPDKQCNRKRTVQITCTDLCNMTLNIVFSSGNFCPLINFTFSSITILNSHFVLQNINLEFENVTFRNVQIIDDPPRPGTFGQILLSFYITTIEDLTTERSLVELDDTFLVFLILVVVTVESTNVDISSSHLFVLAADSIITFSQIELKATTTALCTFERVWFAEQKSPGIQVNAMKVKAEFHSVSVTNSQGGISLQNAESRITDSWMEVIIVNSTFANNTKYGAGGAVGVVLYSHQTQGNSSSFVIIADSKFENNIAKEKSAVYAHGGVFTLSHSLLIHLFCL